VTTPRCGVINRPWSVIESEAPQFHLVQTAPDGAAAGPTLEEAVKRRLRVLVAARDGERGGRLACIVTQLAVSRAPRIVMTTTPAAKTRAAQSAAPRS
jgi:hypothetical protein